MGFPDSRVLTNSSSFLLILAFLIAKYITSRALDLVAIKMYKKQKCRSIGSATYKAQIVMPISRFVQQSFFMLMISVLLNLRVFSKEDETETTDKAITLLVLICLQYPVVVTYKIIKNFD
jgi:uncharacterized membrane protein